MNFMSLLQYLKKMHGTCMGTRISAKRACLHVWMSNYAGHQITLQCFSCHSHFIRFSLVPSLWTRKESCAEEASWVDFTSLQAGPTWSKLHTKCTWLHGRDLILRENNAVARSLQTDWKHGRIKSESQHFQLQRCHQCVWEGWSMGTGTDLFPGDAQGKGQSNCY